MARRDHSKAGRDDVPVTESNDPLAKFLVMSFDNVYENDGPAYTERTRVYLLNPRTYFPGFGGSRSGLVTGDTASLIVRQTGPWGCKDTEYDLADPKAWGWLNRLILRSCLRDKGTFHLIGLNPEV